MKKSFVEHLEGSLDYIRGFAAAQVVFQLLEAGVLEQLKQPQTVDAIAGRFNFKKNLLTATFLYLEREGIIGKSGEAYSLTEKGTMIVQQRGWYELLVGGYGPVFGNMTDILKNGTEVSNRNSALVGRGSCNMSNFNAIPLSKKLMQAVNPRAKRLVDFGCGNSLYLCTFCEQMPGMTAIGIEPSQGAVEEGRRLIKQRGLQDRITLVNSGALDFEIKEVPDFIMFCFVLQELYGQHSESEIVRYLSHFAKKFPNTHLLVIEVDYDLSQENVLSSKFGMGYYNPYFLLHPFTDQQLLPDSEWRRIFATSGYDVVKFERVDPAVDPTGLEMGYVLKPRS